MKQQPFAQKTGQDCETNVKNCLGNTPKYLLGGESHLLQRTKKTNASFCTKTFTMPDETLVEPRWNLGGALANLPTLWKPKTDLPQKTRDTTKLDEPWCGTFRGTLWAAQNGSAPENHRESESDSAPKPCLRLKTPKLLLLGNDHDGSTKWPNYYANWYFFPKWCDAPACRTTSQHCLHSVWSISISTYRIIGMYPQMLSIR